MQVNGPKMWRPWRIVCSLRPGALFCLCSFGVGTSWMPGEPSITGYQWHLSLGVLSFEVWSTLVCRFSFEVSSRISQALCSFQSRLNKNSKPHYRSQPVVTDVTELREKKKANVPFLVIVSRQFISFWLAAWAVTKALPPAQGLPVLTALREPGPSHMP